MGLTSAISASPSPETRRRFSRRETGSGHLWLGPQLPCSLIRKVLEIGLPQCWLAQGAGLLQAGFALAQLAQTRPRPLLDSNAPIPYKQFVILVHLGCSHHFTSTGQHRTLDRHKLAAPGTITVAGRSTLTAATHHSCTEVAHILRAGSHHPMGTILASSLY